MHRFAFTMKPDQPGHLLDPSPPLLILRPLLPGTGRTA